MDIFSALPDGVTKGQVARSFSPKRMELTILPTEKCNFRCTYCYEDFEIGRMPQHVVGGIKELINVRAPELRELSISWFGGEPLLARGVIRAISEHCHRLAEKHGFNFSGGLTTNAYLLTPEVLAELVSLNQDFFQITLDGWEAVHDRTRRRADGAGTFDRIWANLLAAKQTDLVFSILLRIHVSHDNHESLDELCMNIHREFGGDKRFSIEVQDVRNLGGAGALTITPVAPQPFKQVAARLKHLVAHGSLPEITPPAEPESADARPVGESAGSRAGYMQSSEAYICYASKPNHLLIRANGRVGKCTVALDDDRNDIGWINPDGTLRIDQDKAGHWSAGFSSLDLSDLACPLSTLSKRGVVRESKRPIEVAVL
jgi:uncharacterized protein